MKTGLKIIFSSLLICIIITLIIVINFLYGGIFKVNYNHQPEIQSVETFESKINIKGIDEIIKVSKYKSHLGFEINYEVDKFRVSLQSDASVYFYLRDNKEIYLRIEKVNEKDYYESYNMNIFNETINNFNYNYTYLKDNETYFKITIKNAVDSKYDDLNERFNYMVENFYII